MTSLLRLRKDEGEGTISLARSTAQLAGRFHRDEGAQIIFIGIFGSIAFTLLLAFVLNNSANLHEKIRMQNAADAASLAAAQVFADGMNTISDNNVAITEFLALKSISQAMVPMASSLISGHYETYLALLEACVEQPELWPLKEKYRIATNFDRLVLDNEGYFNDQIPQKCDSAIQNFQSANDTIMQSTPDKAKSAADEVARKNGARTATLAGPPRIPADKGEGGMADWYEPTETGSQPGGDTDRRGYYYLYHEYDLMQGPFPKFVEEANVQAIEAVGDRDEFENWANTFLVINLTDMSPAWRLQGFEDAYKGCGILTVVYGERKKAVMVPGAHARDLSPFSRRLHGFEQPQTLGTIAVAEAQVFNPVSWDLFTQYWDVKLSRVKKIPDVTNESTPPIISDEGLYH